MRLIDADALWMEFNNASWYRNADQYEIALPLIDAAPTIDPASLRPKGEWIVCGDGDNIPWMCSHCGKTTAHKYKVMYGNFCPNCGADMRGSQ